MKYRLALKLAPGRSADGKRLNEVALAFAMVRLEQPTEKGVDVLPYEQLEGPGECRVVVYDRPDDMLEPMPLAQFEERLKVVAGTLPDECVAVRVPFDRGGYTEWREKKRRKDTHECRAEWANQLDLEVPPTPGTIGI